jgi:2-dehydro-3-deoxygluconokinase
MKRIVASIGECMVELSERPDRTISRGFGGDTLNTALYMARLGLDVRYVSALGTDPLSDEMIGAWEGEGIGTEWVARVANRLPGLYLIRTDASGERQFLYWRDSAPVRQLFGLPEWAAIERGLCDAGLIYFSGITLSLFDEAGREELFATLRRARLQGARVAFDTNFRPRGWPDRAAARKAYASAFAHADIVFASIEDHAGLHGEGTEDLVMDALRQADVGEFVVKLERPACVVVADGVACRIKAPPVADVVDTTAAGDSFAAAYLAARDCGLAPSDAAMAGHRLAGIVVQHRGAIIPLSAMPGALASEHS